MKYYNGNYYFERLSNYDCIVVYKDLFQDPCFGIDRCDINYESNDLKEYTKNKKLMEDDVRSGRNSSKTKINVT